MNKIHHPSSRADRLRIKKKKDEQRLQAEIKSRAVKAAKQAIIEKEWDNEWKGYLKGNTDTGG